MKGNNELRHNERDNDKSQGTNRSWFFARSVVRVAEQINA